jgi:hypothetical protein
MLPRRLFYVAFGAVAGVLVVRQAARAASALAPGTVAGDLVGQIQEFLADVREYMAEREDEIREALGLYEDEDTPALPVADSDDTLYLPRLRQR